MGDLSRFQGQQVYLDASLFSCVGLSDCSQCLTNDRRLAKASPVPGLLLSSL